MKKRLLSLLLILALCLSLVPAAYAEDGLELVEEEDFSFIETVDEEEIEALDAEEIDPFDAEEIEVIEEPEAVSPVIPDELNVTQSEAVNWARAQENRPAAWCDVDGNDLWCTDLATAYMNYCWLRLAGEDRDPWGTYPYNTAMAKDYDDNFAGHPHWEVISRTVSPVPQPGDLFVSENDSFGYGYGHVGIVLTPNGSTGAEIIEMSAYTVPRIKSVTWGSTASYNAEHFIRFKNFSDTPTPTTVSFSYWESSVGNTYIGETDASMGQQITVSNGTCTDTGFYLYDSNKNELAHAWNGFYSHVVYFKINEELGYTLTPVTTYQYRFTAIVNDTVYWSDYGSFTTGGVLVSYDPNGGNGAPATEHCTTGSTIKLSKTTPVRDDETTGHYTVKLDANGGDIDMRGSIYRLIATRTTSYSFKNWNTKVDGSGASYNPGGSYTANANATLYAQWNSNTTTAAVTLPTPTRDGYSFQNWNTQADGSGTAYPAGDFTPSGTITLYAIWTKNVTITAPVLTEAFNSATGVRVSWKAVDGAAKYELLRKNVTLGETQWKVVGETTACTLIDTTAKSSNRYTYTVRAIDSAGNEGPIDETGRTCTYIAKADITELKVTDMGVSLTWSKPAGAKNFRVMRRLDGTSNWMVLDVVEGTSYVDTTAKTGTKYWYTVRGVSMDNTVLINSYNATGWSMRPLAKPVLTEAFNSSTGVRVSWNAVSKAASYRLLRKNVTLGETQWHEVGTTTNTSLIDTTAKSSNRYTYTVECIDSNGRVCSRRDETGRTCTYIAMAKITSIGSVTNGVKLVWSQPAGAKNFRVFRKTEGGEWKAIKDVQGTSYTDTTAQKGVKYWYTVRAITMDGTMYINSYNATGWSVTRT